MKEIKSHKYIPKSILKRFSIRDKNNKPIIYYYDFKENSVKISSPSSFNTELGYYSPQNEKILAKMAEEKIGNIIRKLENQYKKKQTDFKLTDKEINVIKTFAGFQLIRDVSVIKFIKKAFSIIPIYKGYTNEHALNLLELRFSYPSISEKLLSNILISLEPLFNSFYQSFNELGIVITFNYTNRDFLLSNCLDSICPIGRDEFIMEMALTPKIAISFCILKKYENFFKENRMIIVKITDDIEVEKYNKHFFVSAQNNFPNIIVGNKQELKKIADIVKKMH